MIRKILLYLSLKYQGNYLLIYEAIKRKEKVNEKDLINIEKQIKSKYITIIDKEYPIEYKNIPNPPFVLYYYGDLSLLTKNRKIVLIGKRINSEYGEKMTRKLISEMVKYQPVIISGLAKGIDSIAHIEALKNNISTIAVLGSGIDYCYPKENLEIYNEIKKCGLILSEYPNDTHPERKNFLIRNRLIAALGESVVIIESAIKSGTMNTTSYALEYGKDICCVPTNALENSGCNYLIKQGAKLVENVHDIFDDEL